MADSTSTNIELVRRWQLLDEEMKRCAVRMLAVSKYRGDSEVQALAGVGQQEFAESRPQALRDRALRFPELNWHMIGPVQKNKAKYVARYACMWHSLCDIAVAEAVAGHLDGRMLPVLIQVNVSGELKKSGIAPEQLHSFLDRLKLLKGLKVVGLMAMAAKVEDVGRDGVRDVFNHLRNLRDHSGDASLGELCMGMSGDYQIAIEQGATMVRLGTLLFGTTKYG